MKENLLFSGLRGWNIILLVITLRFNKNDTTSENRWFILLNPLNPKISDKDRMDITVKTIINNNSKMDLYIQ